MSKLMAMTITNAMIRMLLDDGRPERRPDTAVTEQR
jgi:hypothetical protein